MKRQFQYIIILITSFCIIGKVSAQDMHMSQFYASPLYLNPGETGNFDGDFRAAANTKSQWMSFTNAYRTAFFAADYSYKLKQTNKLNVGLMVNSDVAGDGSFGTNAFYLTSSYGFYLKDNTFYLSPGLNFGYINHSIDFGALHFSDQWTGNQFDPTLSTTEEFEYDNFGYLDMAAGLSFRYNHEQGVLETGFAASHLNMPQKSFENNNVDLNVRINSYMLYHYQIDAVWTLIPHVSYFAQGKLSELYYGGRVKMKLNNLNLRSMYLGAWMRSKDAGIFMLGFDYRAVTFGISYDLNISDLTVASNGRGGVELSLVYVFKKPTLMPLPAYKRCPSFL